MVKHLDQTIAGALVDDPRHVSVREMRVGGGDARIELRVTGGEIARVIGRQGRTARALRALVDLIARKAGRRVRVEIVE
jgi:predicted RNA-binding protein YlqC (UPF0109 family)